MKPREAVAGWIKINYFDTSVMSLFCLTRMTRVIERCFSIAGKLLFQAIDSA